MINYIYTYRNIKLKLLSHRWSSEINGSINGRYILYGETGTGKTVCLNQVFGKRQNVLWMSAERMTDLCMELLNKKDSGCVSNIDNKNVIIVENVEGLYARDAIKRSIQAVFDKWYKEGKLIICTSSKEDVKFDGFNEIKVRKLRITRGVIKRIATQLGVGVTNSEIKELLKDSKEVVEVVSWLKKKKLLLEKI
ncbi:MAG: hypothetical protein K6G88_00360 [Lachnospiraceae bacterium]|nr:hypothetical protein [Lachnospiraceae bacterium]